MENSASEAYTWYLEANEYQGNLWLKWYAKQGDKVSAIRANGAQIRVYKGRFFPENPEENILGYVWDEDMSLKGNWDTGLRWGGGWHCAMVATPNHAVSNVNQMYVVQVITKEH